jgi:hypothetical protein
MSRKSEAVGRVCAFGAGRVRHAARSGTVRDEATLAQGRGVPSGSGPSRPRSRVSVSASVLYFEAEEQDVENLKLGSGRDLGSASSPIGALTGQLGLCR